MAGSEGSAARRSDRVTRELLWVGALAPVPVVIFALVTASGTAGYSHLSETVSQLAAKAAPHAATMRIGLVVWAVQMEAFAWGFFRRARTVDGSRAIVRLLLIAGVSIQLAAVVPDDLDALHGPATIRGDLHGIFASIAFLCLLGAIVVFARRTAKASGPGWIRSFSLYIAAAIALTGLIFELQVIQSIEGLLQRVIYGLFVVWMEVVIFGWLLLGRNVPARARHTYLPRGRESMRSDVGH
jgi:Protein of unknown function (DUF998)